VAIYTYGCFAAQDDFDLEEYIAHGLKLGLD